MGLLTSGKPPPQESHLSGPYKNPRDGSIVLSERNFLMNKTQLKSILFTFVLPVAIHTKIRVIVPLCCQRGIF